MSQDTVKKFAEYGQSEKGNFRIIDDNLVYPHLYCIGARLVGFAADHHMGILGDDAIKDAEEHGIRCEMRTDQGKCELKYDEHEKSLTVECKIRMVTETGKAVKELQQYLMKLKPLAEKNGYKGFAFVGEDGKGMKTI